MAIPPEENQRPERSTDPAASALRPLSWKAKIIWPVLLVLLPAAIGHFFFAPGNDSEAVATFPQQGAIQAYGKLMIPATGARVPRIFNVAGKTENIPEERRVVVVVDAPDYNLCWPKQPFITPNIPFKTEIFTGRPEGAITVSLYAVDAVYARQIEDWFDSDAMEGMWHLPKRYRLDTIQLALCIAP